MLQRKYSWPNIFHDVTWYVNACTTCRCDKTVRHKLYGPLRFLLIPERPWSSISMDFIEWLPVSEGFDTILVVVDQLTKMAHFIPTRSDIDAPQLAKIFLQNIFTKHRTPADIVSGTFWEVPRISWKCAHEKELDSSQVFRMNAKIGSRRG